MAAKKTTDVSRETSTLCRDCGAPADPRDALCLRCWCAWVTLYDAVMAERYGHAPERLSDFVGAR